MLEAVFKQILNMSITASVVICLILAMRFVLRKYPKKYSYVLWILAGFRLICPVSISSVISIFNLGAFRKAADVLETMEEAPAVYTGAVENKAQQTAAAGAALENVQGKAAAVQEYVQQAPDYWRIAAALWIAGMLVFLLYHLYTCLKTGRLLRTAVKAEKSTDFPQEDGGLSPDYEVFECGAIVSPFVWGLFSPKIYIPFGLEGKQLTYILAHEQFHIRRRDNLAKLLAVALLTVYWFNPVIWLAFYAFSLDMEMSCDEAVTGALDAGGKKEYCQSLVSLAEKRRLLSVGPLAFGESGTGKRIKNILHFRKPLPWVVLCIAIVLVGIAGVTLSDASGVGEKQADTADIEIEDPRPDEQETEDLISEKRRETLETVLTTVFTAPNPELTPVAAYIGLDAEPGTEPENASGASDAFINWDEAVGSYFMDGRLEKFLNESAGIGIQMEAAEENKAFSYVGMEIIEETDFHINCTVRYTIDDEEYQTTAQAWYDSETSAKIKELILEEIH